MRQPSSIMQKWLLNDDTLDIKMTAPHQIMLPNGGRIDICSLYTARRIYKEYKWVVSLLDPDEDLGFTANDHHHYSVHDLEYHVSGYSFLTEKDLEDILSLSLSSGEKGLVHCHAGISRSTAVGIMLAFKHGATLDTIRDGLDWRIASPNKLILEWSSLFFDQDLTIPVNDWWVESLSKYKRETW